MRTWVLLTAMPPTVGHGALIRFAESISSEVVVIVSTQPDEPMALQRYLAIKDFANPLTPVFNFHRQVEQNPQAPGFWKMWQDIFDSYGWQPGDQIVASEQYGADLASALGGVFVPFDIERELYPAKANVLRGDEWTLSEGFNKVLPTFKPYLRKRIVTFGAESCGKTTLAKNLAQDMGGKYIFEYARPYLETVGPDLTYRKMVTIGEGQRALQDMDFDDYMYYIYDTDLFSTIGYWRMHDESFGTMPDNLIADAVARKADLYVICPSNIPMEQDPLRYGGDHRESTDQYWIDLCKEFGLNYMMVHSPRELERCIEVLHSGIFDNPLEYERSHNA